MDLLRKMWSLCGDGLARALNGRTWHVLTLAALTLGATSVQAQSPTSIALTSSLNPASTSQNITFSATVTPSNSTGTVVFRNETGNADLSTKTLSSSGVANTTTSFTSANVKVITATYSGDATHAGSTTYIDQRVNNSAATVNATIALNVIPSTATVGQTVTFTATVTGTSPSAQVHFREGATDLGTGSGTTSGNTLTSVFKTSSLAAGNHAVRAVFYGDSTNKSAVSSNVTVTVSNAAPTTTTVASSLNPSRVGESVTFTANVTGSSPTGTVTFKDNGVALGDRTLSSGQASYATSALADTGSSHAITATYNGDAVNASSTGTLAPQQAVNKWATATAISVAPTSASAGQTVTFTATVTGGSSPGGTVTFLEGTPLGSATVIGGQAVFSTNALTGGTTHSVSATYNGDPANASSSTSVPASVTVAPPAPTTTTVSSSLNPSKVGQSVTFTANVSGSSPTGTVSFMDSGVLLAARTVSSGQASYTTSALADTGASHAITAVYSGDTVNASSTGTLTPQQAVNKWVTLTAISVTPTSANAGQTVTFTATVTGGSGPSGSVTFFEGATLGSAPVIGGQAVYSTSTLTGGATHSVNATYGGDSGNFTSTSTAPAVVTISSGPTATTTTLTSSSPNPANLGQSLTFTATVVGSNPTGTVTFKDGTTTLASQPLSAGQASYSSSALGYGVRLITAVYGGDAGNVASTSTPALIQAVNKTTGTTTTTSLSATPSPSTLGATVTLTGNVPDGNTVNQNATMTFFDGTSPLGWAAMNNRAGSITIASLPAGRHILKAVYSGNSGNASSTSPNVALDVKGPSTTTLGTSVTPSAPGSPVTFTATVVGTLPSGSVTFVDTSTGNNLGTMNLTGSGNTRTAQVTTSTLTSGTHVITSSYAGDSSNTSSASSLTQSVKFTTSTTLSSSPLSSTYGQGVLFTATVSGSSPTGSVTFKDGASTLGTGSLSAGTATYTTSVLAATGHVITADYAGDAINMPSVSPGLTQTVSSQATTSTLTASPSSPPFGQPLTLTLSVTGTNVNGTATFTEGSTTLGIATVTNGVGTLVRSDLAIGSHNVAASYTPDTNHTGSNAQPITVTIAVAPTTITLTTNPASVTAGETVALFANVTGANPTGTVALTVDSASAGTVQVVNGSATFNLGPLTQGIHSIVASYSGDVSNAPSSTTVPLTVNALAGYTWQYGYDPMGRMSALTDPNALAAAIQYDALGRVRTTIQPPNTGSSQPTVIAVQRDANDAITKITDPRTLDTTYLPNGLGDVKSQSSPDSGTSTYGYDDKGNLTSITDARNKVTGISYDSLDRVKAISYAAGIATKFGYDGVPIDCATNCTPIQVEIGQLSSMTDESGGTSYVHDAMGRLTLKTVTIGAKTFTVSYAWGDAGSALDKVTAITYPSGARVNYSYDVKGNVSGITVNPAAAGGGTSATTTTLLSGITYNVDNAATGWLWADGKARTIGYDNAGLVTSYTLGDSQSAVAAKKGALRTVVRDPAGRITGYTHTNSATPVAELNQGFGYDNLDRLTSNTVGSLSINYAYDATGNRTSKQEGGTTYTNAVAATSNRYTQTQDATSGTATPIYDAAGHLTSDGVNTFNYNDRGRMTNSTTGGNTTNYTYNGLNLRAAKSGANTAFFVYDEAGQLLGEYDASGAPLYETAYLGATPVGVMKPAGLYNLYADQVDAPRMITAQDHTIVWRWDTAEAFGATAPDQNPNGLGTFTFNQRFPGQVFDSETGLFQNWNREYNARLGRYIQSDPIGLNGGINTFAYVDGNPLGQADLRGLDNPRTGPYGGGSGNTDQTCTTGDANGGPPRCKVLSETKIAPPSSCPYGSSGVSGWLRVLSCFPFFSYRSPRCVYSSTSGVRS